MSHSQLRPLAFGEILDGAFTLYRRHFAAFLRTSLLSYAPVLVAWAVVGALANGAASIAGLLALVPAYTFATAVSAGAVTRMASNAYLAQAVDSGAALREARGRFLTLWATTFLQGVIVGIGFMLLAVPGFVFMAMFFAMVPAVVIEGLNSSTSQARSRELARGAWRSVLGVQVVFIIIAWLPTFVIKTATEGGATALIGAGPSTTAIVQMMTVVATCFTMPLSTLGTVLLYYDRRVRTEALDLELAPEAAPGPAAYAAH